MLRIREQFGMICIYKKERTLLHSKVLYMFVWNLFFGKCVLNLFDYASAAASVVSVSAVSAASASAFAAASAAFLSATF
jgi:hypothetical protein